MRLIKLFTPLLLIALLAASTARAQPKGDLAGLKDDVPIVETRTDVPTLKTPATYQIKNNTVELELSEYAGYSGLIVANNGLDATEDSFFFKKHGFKVKITLSESESWSALNSGRIAASATTVDVLAVYGKQFQVVVPAQIGFSRGADGIIVQSSIKKINDLKGKIIASCQFTEADFFLRYLAQEAGLQVNMLPDMQTPPDKEKLNVIFCADAEGAAQVFLRDLKAGRNRLAGAVSWAPFTTDTVEASDGKATLLVTNRNLLVVADILVVNKGFEKANSPIVAGLVEGLLQGNRMVRDDSEKYLDVIGKAFKWDKAEARAELGKVHLSNLPENVAFFSGAIDAAGSYGGIYQSAIYSYGSDLIKNPVDGDRFLELKYLKDLEQKGLFKDQKIAIAPLRSGNAQVEGDALLSKNIRFLYVPNSADLDMNNQDNLKSLESIKKMLQVGTGSTVALKGHVDNARVPDFRKQGGEALVRSMAMKAMQLSKDRASGVKKVLVEKYAVPEDRLEPVGRGWEEPLGTDSDQNRRVEAVWLVVE